MKKILVCLFISMIAISLASCEKEYTIYDAILNEDIEYIENYDGGKFNLYDEEKGYPLSFACINGASSEIIHKLIDGGSNTALYDHVNKCTPLSALYKVNHSEKEVLSKLLFDYGADQEGTVSDFELVVFNKDINGLNIECFKKIINPIEMAIPLHLNLSYEVLEYILTNDLLTDEVRFSSVALDMILTDIYEKDANSEGITDELMNYMNERIDIIKLLLESEIDYKYINNKDAEVFIKTIRMLESSDFDIEDILEKLGNSNSK